MQEEPAKPEESLAAVAPTVMERRAVWWSWPVILVSVFFIGWSVNVFDFRSGQADLETGAAARTPERVGDLALLKLQSQIVIAAAAVNATDASKTLRDLESSVRGDRMLVSFALLESFVDLPDSDPRGRLDDLSSEASSLRELARKALAEGIGEEDREELAGMIGWFAVLAPAPGPADPPMADRIRTKSVMVLVLGVFAFLGALSGILAGGAFLIWLLRNRQGGNSSYSFDPAHTPRGVLLESFALYLGIMAGGEVLGILVHPGFSVSSYGLAVVVPLLWPFARGVRWKDFSRSLGLHSGKGVWREIRAGAVGYLGVLAIASIGIFLTFLLTFMVGAVQAEPPGPISGGKKLGPPPAPEIHPIVGWIYAGGLRERLLCFLLAAGFAPIFEEIFFRGALHRALRGRFSFLVSALVTGLIFAALHPQGWMGIPALAAIGVGFSLLREWRDSLIAPMVAHAINNGILVGILSFAL